MAGGPNININIGAPKPRRRRRRRVAGGLAGLIALALAAWFAAGKTRSVPAGIPRLPSAPAAADALRGSEFGKGLEPVPATVIDQGPLRRVPYLSHRAGELELNVYGDPEAPACVEIGWGGDPSRHTACRDVLAGLLIDPADRDAVRALDPAKGKSSRGGLTFEITPDTAPDAYGAWWVSVYDLKALDAARASDGDFQKLSKPRPAGDARKRRRPGAVDYVQDFIRKEGRYLPR